jgi:hypothetical protein
METSGTTLLNADCLTFTSHQVNEMTDEELLCNFTQVTGREYLSCKHCHNDKVELTSFSRVIRKWCLKKSNDGMRQNMSIPKTCDFQSLRGEQTQAIYRKIRKAQTSEFAQEIKNEYNDILHKKERRPKTIRRSKQIKISDGVDSWLGVSTFLNCKKITYAKYKKQLASGLIFIVSDYTDENVNHCEYPII